MRPILAPIDDPELAACAFWHVGPLLGPDGPPLVLLDAHSRGEAPDLRIARLLRMLEANGARASAELVEGDLASATLEQVHALDPELVLLATGTRRSAVAERLLRQCPAPLLLLNPDTVASRFERILVPLDGSELSEQILPLVGWLGRTYGSQAILLRVHPEGHPGDDGLGPAAERLAAEGLAVQRLAARDADPAQAILASVELERADLVAMTTHGRTALDRWAFGSVTEKVLAHCHVPLLVRRVVPPAPRPEPTPPPMQGWGEPGMRTRRLNLRRVLLPLDGTRFSERAVHVAPRLLTGTPVHCVLLRVLPETLELGSAEAAQTAIDEERRDLRDLQDDVLADWKLESRVVVGDPAARILAAAEEERADLIVMASHCREGISRWLRGSVAGRVLRRSEVPVLVCPPSWLEHAFWDQGGVRRILVPLDGSERACAALPLAEDLARRQGARLTLLRVGAALPEADATIQAEHERQLLVSLEPERVRIAASGIPVDVKAALGDPAECILEASAKVDLVAMSTHGRSGAARWLLGSVAERVLRACEHPLLLVRATG